MTHNLRAGDVLARLQAVIGVANDSQLATRLDINRQTVGSWRARDSIPYELCVSLAVEHQVSLDWLLTGEGPMRKGAPATGLATESAREEGLLTLFRELGEDEQREIQHLAAEKKRLREVERRLAEVSATLAARKSAS